MKTLTLMSWATAVVVSVAVTPAESAGLYNMPTTLRQCLGVGFGPGYHAPLALGIPGTGGIEGRSVRYSLHPPKSMGCPGGFCGGMTTMAALPHHAPHPMPTPYRAAPTHRHMAPTPAMRPTPAATTMPAPRVPGEPRSPSDQPTPESLPLPPAN